MNEKLHAFLRHAREKGLDYATIRTLLLAAGWKERDIATAIANDGLELPVPEPAGAHSARDAFLYLLMFVALYTSVTSTICLFNSYLSYLFPDAAFVNWNTDGMLEGVRYAIAAIIIAFPVFLGLSTLLQRAVAKDADGQVHPTQKWLTYLTIFLASAIILGDLITLLFCFLDGSLTTRFVLKAVVLLVVLQVVFSYYYFAPRPNATRQPSLRLRKWIGVAGLLLVTGSVVLGFAMAGSPVTARMRRLDEKRVQDLRAIERTIQDMVTKTDRNTKTVTVVRPLPITLDEVAAFQKTREDGRKLDLVDPQTGEKYAYTTTGEKTYELSATFELAREKKQDLFWNHPAGKYTFQFDAGSPP
jgi:Domain of unknown function (DUF5671)